jgi:hypothetical protein
VRGDGAAPVDEEGVDEEGVDEEGVDEEGVDEEGPVGGRGVAGSAGDFVMAFGPSRRVGGSWSALAAGVLALQRGAAHKKAPVLSTWACAPDGVGRAS